MRRYLTVSIVFVLLAIVPGAAGAAVGDQLDKFAPSPGGDGRAISILGSTFTAAFYTTQFTLEDILLIDLKTHAYLGKVTTDLPSFGDGNHSWGALGWDENNTILWGAEYDGTNGRIDRIDPLNGAVTRVFDAHADDANNFGLDAMGVDTDGSLWISQDGTLIGTTTIYHYSPAGTVLGTFVAPFGNSGIAVDGADLWLADNDNSRIHKYNKSGVDQGVTIDTGADVHPEGLTIDQCSFTGKKAIWTYGSAAGGSGQMAAFEIGTSANTGCPVTQPTTENPPTTPPSTPGGPETITIGDGHNHPVAGTPIWLDATSPYDSTGSVFVYIWLFGDYRYNINQPHVSPTLKDAVQDKGKIQHTFECAGFYAPKVTVIDQLGNRKEVSKDLTVQFSKTATKKHGSLQVSPNLVASETRAKINLTAKKLKKKRGRTKIKSILYKLDGKKLGTRKKAKKAMIAKIKRAGPHTLQIDVKFKGPKGKKRIKECFQLS